MTSTVGQRWRNGSSAQSAPFYGIKVVTSATSLTVTATPYTGGTILFTKVNGVYYSSTTYSGSFGVPEAKAIALPAGTNKSVEFIADGGGDITCLEISDITGAFTFTTPTPPAKRVVILGDSISVSSGALPQTNGWAIALALSVPSEIGVIIDAISGQSMLGYVTSLTATVDYLETLFDGTEENILYVNLGINDWGLGQTAAQFVANCLTLRNAVKARIPGVRFLWSSPVLRSLEGTANPPAGTMQDLRDAEQAFAAAVGDPFNPGETTLIYPTDISADGKHPTNSGHAKMTARGLLLMQQYEGTMGTLSTYALNASLDHLLGIAAYSAPATLYVAAFVAGTEVSGGSYARCAVTNNTTNFPNASGRAKTNGAPFTWASAATSNWGAIDEVRIYDASSGGNELARDALSSVTINSGLTFSIPAGSLSITAPAGSVATAHVHLMLNHMFGAVAWTAQATLKFSYWAGDPQGAGSEITGTGYTRQSVTNDGTSWTASSAGVSMNKNAFSLGTAGAADWTTATYWALLDNAGTGVVISALLPVARSVANGTTETIQANRVRPTWA